jgi:hypothetical protein
MSKRKTAEHHGTPELSRRSSNALLADALRGAPSLLNVSTVVYGIHRKSEEVHCYPHESGITYIRQDAGEFLFD